MTWWRLGEDKHEKRRTRGEEDEKKRTRGEEEEKKRRRGGEEEEKTRRLLGGRLITEEKQVRTVVEDVFEHHHRRCRCGRRFTLFT